MLKPRNSTISAARVVKEDIRFPFDELDIGDFLGSTLDQLLNCMNIIVRTANDVNVVWYFCSYRSCGCSSENKQKVQWDSFCFFYLEE